MGKVIIFGLKEFAVMMCEFIVRDGKDEVAGFCVDEAYLPQKRNIRVRNKKYSVVAYEKLEEYYKPEEYGICLCIGYTKMNQIREKKYKDSLERGYVPYSYIHPSAVVLTENVGGGNLIMENVTIGHNVEIGNGNIFWPCSHVAHDTIVGNFNFFTISSVVAGGVSVSDNCVFGANSTVKNGVKIGKNTLVGAAAYIRKDTEENSVYVPPGSYRLEGKSSLDFKL